MDETVSSLRSTLGWGLLLFGVAAFFAPLIGHRVFKRFGRCMAVSMLCIFFGIACIEPMLAAGIVGYVAFLIGILVVIYIQETRLAKQFPVFDTEPKFSFMNHEGERRDLYIAEVKSRFIIGMIYEQEIDGTNTVLSKRWKDKFETYEEAKAALLDRALVYTRMWEIPVKDILQHPAKPITPPVPPDVRPPQRSGGKKRQRKKR